MEVIIKGEPDEIAALIVAIQERCEELSKEISFNNVSGSTLANRRKQLGLSQLELAKVLGVDQTAVHNWERGKTMPSTKRLPAIAKALNCTVDELLTPDEPET